MSMKSYRIVTLAVVFLVMSAGICLLPGTAQAAYLELVPLNQSIPVHGTASFQLLAHNDDGSITDVTNNIYTQWDVINPAIASNLGGGQFYGLAEGNTQITGYYALLETTLTGELTVQGKVTDESRPVFEVRPPTHSVPVGANAQYAAFLVWPDASQPDQDVTAACVWSIDSPAIAANNGSGSYTGTAVGTTLVRANYDYSPPSDPSKVFKLDGAAELIVFEKDQPDLPPDNQPPPHENLPEGKIIDRQPGYIVLADPVNLGSPGAEFVMNYDASRMDTNTDRYPKAFYFNTTYHRWVALTSYPAGAGQVRVVNDGGYSGWFVVFGCIQPRFTDIPAGFWGEDIANRMNGLGLLEGYPNYANPSSLLRPCGLDVVITRVEVTVACARILGLAPGETTLYPTLTWMGEAQNDAILNSTYSDGHQILAWARPYVAAMTQKGYVSGQSGAFNSNVPMTRIEAAVMISNALRDIPGFGTPADLTVYTDSSEVPAWAHGNVAQGTISGYPDGSLKPNKPIDRSETLALLLNLLKGLGW